MAYGAIRKRKQEHSSIIVTKLAVSYLYINGTFRPDASIVQRDNGGGYCYISFGNGLVTPYPSGFVVELSESRELMPPYAVRRRSDGFEFNVSTVIEYSRGSYSVFEVTFPNGQVKVYESSYLQIEESIRGNTSNDVFSYLKEIAGCNAIPSGEDRSISLRDKYERVSFIAKDSLLSLYLAPKPIFPKNSKGADSGFIFPFGCNRSQYKAVQNALNNRISVIQGPPGTGKTQTILNIIANLLLRGQTAEIVSNNNSAVENVLEKLAKPEYGLDFLVAQLGKNDNKIAFIAGQNGQYPDLSSWRKEEHWLKQLKNFVNSLSCEIQVLYENQEKLAKERETLHEAEVQYKYLQELEPLCCPIPKKALEKAKDENEIQSLMNRCELDLLQRKRLRLSTVFLLWRWGLNRNSHRSLILQNLYYQRFIENACCRISSLEASLSGFGDMEKSLEMYSLEYLKGFLYSRYGERKSRFIFKREDIEYLCSERFLKEYPVVLSTTFSATTNINKSVKFDYLIVDEASQVDVSAGALALCCANNAVIVGDLKQLPNVVDENTRLRAEYIYSSYDIAPAYRYTQNSFLASVCQLPLNVPKVLLREHYRCHPLIIGFCNRMFYGGDLVAMTKGTADDHPMTVLKTVAGNQARGTFNLRQAQEIVHTIIPDLDCDDGEIGIIAPYNDQVQTIKRELKSIGREGIPVATVHKFQGQEKDVIILSTVDNVIKEFVDDPHLLNVAVSRAKKKFFLVVSGNDLPDSNIKALIEYISYYGGSTIEGKLSSVFDMLYEVNSPAREAFMAEHMRISRYDSENILYGVICDVIKKEQYQNLGIAFNHPLRYILKDLTVLNDYERQYTVRDGTHIDFLIFDKVTKMPVLAIEADGYIFHKEGSLQYERDQMKNSILDKCGLPLLRLSTLGSNEYTAISKAIDKNLKKSIC